MAEKTEEYRIDNLAASDGPERQHDAPVTDENEVHIHLTWRSWLVVFISCFAVMAQVFVVVAAGSVIAFIIRDLGSASISGWIIQGPLLMQCILSPFVGRLSDVLDRKFLATGPPLIAFAGAVISARASSMSMLIFGGILIGVTLSTVSIVQAIPSEVLPLKYRAIANGLAGIGGYTGGLVGGLGAGAVTNIDAGGWRGIFWMQAAFHLATALGFGLFYWPKKRSDYPRMSFKQYVWAIDPIGTVLFIISATLMLLALDWAGGAYPWSDSHVAAPLAIGLCFLVIFCLYEWKGRDDGLLAHVFFRGSPNFALANFAFAIEGWVFYSAVNSVTPQIVLHLGFETNSLIIAVRQMAFTWSGCICAIVVMLYATRYKELKWPLVITWSIFLIAVVCYGCIKPSWNKAQIGLNVVAGIGQAGPLTLLVALIQLTAPHSHLAVATGLAFSSRAIGGAFGSAVLGAIINGKLSHTLSQQTAAAAVKAGLPESSLPALLKAMAMGEGLMSVPGITKQSLAAAIKANRAAYAHAYRLAWWSIFPFVVLAIICVACLKSVKELMTEKVEATVEDIEVRERKVGAA